MNCQSNGICAESAESAELHITPFHSTRFNESKHTHSRENFPEFSNTNNTQFQLFSQRQQYTWSKPQPNKNMLLDCATFTVYANALANCFSCRGKIKIY